MYQVVLVDGPHDDIPACEYVRNFDNSHDAVDYASNTLRRNGPSHGGWQRAYLLVFDGYASLEFWPNGRQDYDVRWHTKSADSPAC